MPEGARASARIRQAGCRPSLYPLSILPLANCVAPAHVRGAFRSPVRPGSKGDELMGTHSRKGSTTPPKRTGEAPSLPGERRHGAAAAPPWQRFAGGGGKGGPGRYQSRPRAVGKRYWRK
jgi:hypothetical protein